MSSLDGRRLRCDPFLIVFPLIPCRLPVANDSYDVLSLNEADQQQAVPRRVPDDNLASLADGEIFVVEDPRQRVAKYTGGAKRRPLHSEVRWVMRHGIAPANGAS